MTASPAPLLLLNQREVDTLYELTAQLIQALEELGVPYVPIAGSLLGAVRSQSVLFNDDDVDVAVIPESEGEYERLRRELPRLLPPELQFKHRATPFCDRLRSKKLSHVWVDVFVLKRYETMEDVVQVVSRKENGDAQSDAYVYAITQALPRPEGFPIYHYDSRKGMELWPREFFQEDDLLPIRPTSLAFGHLSLASPSRPLAYLRRAFGQDCFQAYPNPHTSAHLFVPEFQKRLALATADGRAPPAEAPPMLPLSPQHFIPVQHSKRGCHSTHCQQELLAWIDRQQQQEEEEEEAIHLRSKN